MVGHPKKSVSRRSLRLKGKPSTGQRLNSLVGAPLSDVAYVLGVTGFYFNSRLRESILEGTKRNTKADGESDCSSSRGHFSRSVSLEDWWSSLFGCRNKERDQVSGYLLLISSCICLVIIVLFSHDRLELEVISLEASPSKTGGPLRLAAGIKSEDQEAGYLLLISSCICLVIIVSISHDRLVWWSSLSFVVNDAK
ncbi:hypothetical protein GW17_00005607 [Ensete ventricosum]|nr:hypothetical protein GW17_00005607 [Ensete ventricosum]RZR98545.1 hypothetical protein BHM03_00027914 [Ensete ventricosum]